MELYKKHRPKTFKEIVGQEAVVKSLQAFLKNGGLPHTLLFAGPSGCGKTTFPRILANKLQCSIDADYHEVNCADFRGVDMVREIRSRMQLNPVGGGEARVWVIDEAHQLTSAAQNAFLKILEDTPEKVYFMLATTEPEKLIKTVQTRCTRFDLIPLEDKKLRSLLWNVIGAEDAITSEEAVEKIIQYSNGSPRQALVFLNQIIDVEDEEQQLQLVAGDNREVQSIELCRILLKSPTKGTWSQVAKMLEKLKGDPESVRYHVLAYARSVLLRSGNGRAAEVINAFADNFYDSKDAGLALACWDVCSK